MASYEVRREVVDEALSDAFGFGPGENVIREDYSGRGMFGAECFGVVLDGPGALAHFVLAMDDRDVGSSIWLGDVKEDQMGLQTIYYWPSVKVIS